MKTECDQFLCQKLFPLQNCRQTNQPSKDFSTGTVTSLEHPSFFRDIKQSANAQKCQSTLDHMVQWIFGVLLHAWSILYSCLKGGMKRGGVSSLDLYKLEPNLSLSGSHRLFRRFGDPPHKCSPCLVGGNPAGWIIYTSAWRHFSSLLLSVAFLKKKIIIKNRRTF